jgi:hypothetical protein
LPKSPISPKNAKIETKTFATQRKGVTGGNPAVSQQYQILFTSHRCSALPSAIFGNFGTSGNRLIRLNLLRVPSFSPVVKAW